MAIGIVWRKSIYDNRFKCNQCGAKLADKNGQPTDNFVVDADREHVDEKDEWAFCGKCMNVVAKIKEISEEYISEEEKENVLNGSYEDWIEKKARDIQAKMLEQIEKRVAKKYEQKVKAMTKKVDEALITVNNIKLYYEKKIALKDKQIQALTKDLEGAEADMRRMEKQMKGRISE